MPTPDPKANSLRTSLTKEISMAMRGSIAPGGVIPPQDVIRHLRPPGHVLDQGRRSAPEIGKLAVRQAEAGGGPERHHAVPFRSHSARAGAGAADQLAQAGIVERPIVAPRDDRLHRV